MAEQPSQRIRLRVPGIFKFLALLNFALGLWLFYPWPADRSELINDIEAAATLWAATLFLFGLFLTYRVSYSGEGFYIRPNGWKTLLGLQREHFVRFEEIRFMTPQFDRGGGGRMDWLMFGYLQLHTEDPRDDGDELVLRQIFLNRAQLTDLLSQLKEKRPDIIDQDILDSLASA